MYLDRVMKCLVGIGVIVLTIPFLAFMISLVHSMSFSIEQLKLTVGFSLACGNYLMLMMSVFFHFVLGLDNSAFNLMLIFLLSFLIPLVLFGVYVFKGNPTLYRVAIGLSVITWPAPMVYYLFTFNYCGP